MGTGSQTAGWILERRREASVPITFDVTCKLGTASEYYFPGHAILLLSHVPSKIHQQWIGLHCAY